MIKTGFYNYILDNWNMDIFGPIGTRTGFLVETTKICHRVIKTRMLTGPQPIIDDVGFLHILGSVFAIPSHKLVLAGGGAG